MARSTHILNTIPDVLALERDWKRMLDVTGDTALHMSWPWVSAWLDVYGGDDAMKPSVVVVRDAGEIVGIAPLMIVHKRSRLGIPYRELRFLCEGGEVSFDYMRSLVHPHWQTEVLDSFGSAVSSLTFDTLALSKTVDTDFPGALGATVTKSNVVAPVAHLGGDWETFLAGRSSKFRSNLKRYQRKCEEKGEVRYLRVGHDISFENGFQALIELNRERWGEDGDSFRTQRYNGLQKRVARDALATDRLWLRFLNIGDTIAAAKYNIEYAGRMYSLQAGRLPEFSKCGIGHLLVSYVFQEAIGKGITEVDFMPGAGYHKEAWADEEIQLYKLHHTRNTPAGIALKVEDQIRQLYRRIR